MNIQRLVIIVGAGSSSSSNLALLNTHLEQGWAVELVTVTSI